MPRATAEPGPVEEAPRVGGVVAASVRSVYQGRHGGVWVRLDDGTSGFLPTTALPPWHDLHTFKQGDTVPVERDVWGEVNGRRVLLVAYRGSVTRPAPPEKGDRFDDAQLVRRTPSVAVLRFGGRFTGTVAIGEFDRQMRANPARRHLGVEVLRFREQRGDYVLRLLNKQP